MPFWGIHYLGITMFLSNLVQVQQGLVHMLFHVQSSLDGIETGTPLILLRSLRANRKVCILAYCIQLSLLGVSNLTCKREKSLEPPVNVIFVYSCFRYIMF